MVRNLWELAIGLACAGCAAQATQPQSQLLPQNANVEASRAPATAPAASAESRTGDPVEADESEAARQRIHAWALKRQTQERERSEALRIREEQEAVHTRADWLKLAREVCRPIRCDGGPIDVNCYGGNPPEWSQVQAGTEACAKRQLEKER